MSDPARGKYVPPAEQQLHVELRAPEHPLKDFPPQLRELWDDPVELIDVPPKEFFHETDEAKLKAVMGEFYDEMKVLAKKYIKQPEGSGPDTMYGEAEIEAVKERIREQLKELQEYALGIVKERHELRYTDKLTGELSKAGLEQRYYTELKRLETLEDGRVMVLVEFDIDSFKKVNDMLGHTGADEIITRLAAEIKSVLSELDSVGRRSGDELSIILNNVAPEALPSILVRISAAANNIELVKTLKTGEKRSTGQFLSVTGAARTIERDKPISYEEASRDADVAATYQKINRPGTIIEWSPDLKPDLGTIEKRREWADKLASNHLKRDSDTLHAELVRYEPGSEKYRITEQQIGRIQDAKDIWIEIYLGQIDKEHGRLRAEATPLSETSNEPKSLLERSKAARQREAERRVRDMLAAQFQELDARAESLHGTPAPEEDKAFTVWSKQREELIAMQTRLQNAFTLLTQIEVKNFENKYGEASED